MKTRFAIFREGPNGLSGDFSLWLVSEYTGDKLEMLERGTLREVRLALRKEQRARAREEQSKA